MPAKKKTAKTKKAVTRKEEAIVQEEYADDFSDDQFGYDHISDSYIYSWQAPEFVYHEKPLWWHVAVYSTIGVLAVSMLFLQEWFASVVFVLLGIAVYRFADVKPNEIDVVLTEVGVQVGHRFFPYNEIKSFWVIYNPPVKTLNLEITKRFSPVISLELGENDPVIVKEVLREHVLEEEGRTEDMLEKLVRMFRF